MLDNSTFATAQKIRQDMAGLFRDAIDRSMSALAIEMDAEIEQEIRERIAVLIFDEMVNDMPMVPYLAVWEEGATDIAHAYMSPKIEELCEYTPDELLDVGYVNIVGGNIISFYREESGVEENVNAIAEAQEKRVSGLLENRNWEGCYMVRKKSSQHAWVIDRSTITRFRNTVRDNVICLSNGILMETTELFERKARIGEK